MIVTIQELTDEEARVLSDMIQPNDLQLMNYELVRNG